MKSKKSDAEWKQILSPEVYHVTREKGTEHAFSGKYNKFYSDGTYLCSNCGNSLFLSEHKYDSGSGWPSFYTPATTESVSTQLDKGTSSMQDRTEVICQNCGAHLGHVFEDGPQPTNLRFCMNSVALDFKPKNT